MERNLRLEFSDCSTMLDVEEIENEIRSCGADIYSVSLDNEQCVGIITVQNAGQAFKQMFRSTESFERLQGIL